jgi:hypothetical protein
MSTNNNTTQINKPQIIGVSLTKENAVQALRTILQSDTVVPTKFPDMDWERFYLMFMENKLITRTDVDYTMAFHSFIPVYKSGVIKELSYNADGSKPPYDYIFEIKNRILYIFEGECKGFLSNTARKVKVVYKPTLVIYFSKYEATEPLEKQQYIVTRCIENNCVLQITVDDKLCYQYIGDSVFNDMVTEKTVNYIKYISSDILRVDVKADDIKILEK